MLEYKDVNGNIHSLEEVINYYKNLVKIAEEDVSITYSIASKSFMVDISGHSSYVFEPVNTFPIESTVHEEVFECEHFFVD